MYKWESKYMSPSFSYTCRCCWQTSNMKEIVVGKNWNLIILFAFSHKLCWKIKVLRSPQKKITKLTINFRYKNYRTWTNFINFILKRKLSVAFIFVVRLQKWCEFFSERKQRRFRLKSCLVSNDLLCQLNQIWTVDGVLTFPIMNLKEAYRESYAYHKKRLFSFSPNDGEMHETEKLTKSTNSDMRNKEEIKINSNSHWIRRMKILREKNEKGVLNRKIITAQIC